MFKWFWTIFSLGAPDILNEYLLSATAEFGFRMMWRIMQIEEMCDYFRGNLALYHGQFNWV